MRIKVPFGLQAYEARSLPVNNQEMVNMYAELQSNDGKNKVISMGFPGQTLYATVGNGPIHGMKVMGNYLYAVSGNELYKISNGTGTSVGSGTGNGRVSMAHNNTELCIVNGSTGYTYDTTNGLRSITDGDFYQTSDIVGYLEGRFLFPRKGTFEFFCSHSFDGRSYNALAFEKAQIDPENITTMAVDHGEAWMFSKKGVEVWVYNRNEAADIPFGRVDGSYVEKGCIAKYSIGKIDNTFFWLGDDLVVYKAEGYKPTRVSTHAIEKQIKSYTVSDAFALTYEIDGHSFYELTFPTDKKTWRLDASTGLWAEARHNGSRYNANATEVFEDKVLVGDYQNGNIYELDFDTYTDNGTTITRIVSTPQIHHNRLTATMDHLYIDMEVGVGSGTPQLALEYSKDGGRTWSYKKYRSLGTLGDYSTTVEFDNIGSYKQIMFKLTTSAAMRISVIDAYADVEIDDSY